MTPHLHPRSRSTTSLFAASLFASFVVVGLPHLFPCPAPRRTLADSEIPISPEERQIRRLQRRTRKDINVNGPDEAANAPSQTAPVADEDVSTFLQLEAEEEKLAKKGRECPIPKPGGKLGELLGFKTPRDERQQGKSGGVSQ